MPDYSTTEMVVAFGGTITAGGIITFLLQAVKDFFPRLSGRWAMGSVYITSFLAALFFTIYSNPDYSNLFTYGGFFVVWGSLVVTARGIYHTLFQGPAAVHAVESLNDDTA